MSIESLPNEIMSSILNECVDTSLTGLQTYNNVTRTNKRFQEVTNCMRPPFLCEQQQLGENEFKILRLSRHNVIQLKSHCLPQMSEANLEDLLVCIKYNKLQSSHSVETAVFKTVQDLLHSSLVKSYDKKTLLCLFKKIFDHMQFAAVPQNELSRETLFKLISRDIVTFDQSLTELRVINARIARGCGLGPVVVTQSESYEDIALDTVRSPFAQELRVVGYIKKLKQVRCTSPSDPNKEEMWKQLVLNTLKRVLEKNPKSVFALQARAKVFKILKMPNELLQDCNTALQLDPMNKKVRTLRLGASLEQGNFQAALEDISTLMVIDPNPSRVLERADIYRRLHRFDDAIKDIEAVVDTNHMDKARKIHGDIYADQGRLDKAMEEYKKISDLNVLKPVLDMLRERNKVQESVDLVKALYSRLGQMSVFRLLQWCTWIFQWSGSTLALEAQYEIHKTSSWVWILDTEYKDLKILLRNYSSVVNPTRAIEILREFLPKRGHSVDLVNCCLRCTNMFFSEFIDKNQSITRKDEYFYDYYNDAIEELDAFLQLDWQENVRTYVEKKKEQVVARGS